MAADADRIVELPELRNRTAVFRDRTHAGEILATLLAPFRGTPAVVFAVPAGGVPVAVEIAGRLGLPLEVAVVSKITLPWSTEAGYGAVAFDGTVHLNRELVAGLALGEATVNEGIARTREKVERREKRLRGDRPFPDLAQRAAIVVDDGLASGVTLLAALEALRHRGAWRLVVAVPTGHAEAVGKIVAQCESVYCANIRGGRSFAVADAYAHWDDVSEETAIGLLQKFSGVR
jgi:predicted phosphoribosyltransferase